MRDEPVGPKCNPLPLISVVIPTRERLPLVERAVRSVLAQTVHKYEVIIVDDSRPETFQVLQDRFRHDSRIVVTRGDGVNDATARRRGVELANGRYIAFLDSDDEWRPSFLATHLDIWQRYPQIAFSWSADAVALGDGGLARPRVFPIQGREVYLGREQLCRLLVQRNAVDISSSFASRDDILSLGGFPTEHPCDWRLWVSLSLTKGAVYSSAFTTIHHEEATGRTGFRRRVRVHDAVGTTLFGIDVLRESGLGRDPALVYKWAIERGKDFCASVLPMGAIRGLKSALTYFVPFEADGNTSDRVIVPGQKSQTRVEAKDEYLL